MFRRDTVSIIDVDKRMQISAVATRVSFAREYFVDGWRLHLLRNEPPR